MHLTKVSALSIHIAFTAASVLGVPVPEDQDAMSRRRDWRQAKEEALKRASAAQAGASELVKKYRDHDTPLLTSPIVRASDEAEIQQREPEHEKRQGNILSNAGGWGSIGRGNNNNQNSGWRAQAEAGRMAAVAAVQQASATAWAQIDAGRRAGAAAVQQASDIAQAHRKNNGKRLAEAIPAVWPAPAASHAPAIVPRYDAQPQAPPPPPRPAAHQFQQSSFAGAGNFANGQPDPVPAPGGVPNPLPQGALHDGGANNHWQSVASSYQARGSEVGQSWASYGASVAASAEAHASAVAGQYGGGGDNGGDWNAAASSAVESASSLASSYRGEYAPPPTPTPTMGSGAGEVNNNNNNNNNAGPAGAAATNQPSATDGVVEVNGAEDGRERRLAAATLMGASMAMLAVVFGRL